MAKYMLSWMAQKYRATELKVFRAEFTSNCLVWEPGDWHPPAKGGGTVVTTASPEPQRQKPGADALAILLAAKPDAAAHTLGRDAQCDVVLDDATVSAKHAQLVERGGTWFARGLGATNGTFVNEKPLSPDAEVALAPADRLRLGQVRLTFYDPKGLYFRLKANS